MSNLHAGGVSVNVRSIANSKKAKKTVRNGREVIIVPSATLPDNIVMNGIRYPAEEIEKSYMTLEMTPAPLGHPAVNGGWISARDPEGINRNWIGAHNENVRRENGVVLLDKVIDVQVANLTEGGRKVLEAIDKGEPINTSTGLLAKLIELKNDSEANFQAHSIVFDHDAILLNEEGAATPDKGVGIFVNAQAGDDQLVNSKIEWAEQDLAWAAEHVIDAAERLDKAKARQALVPQIVEALKDLIGGRRTQTEEVIMGNENKAEDTVGQRLTALENKIEGIGELIKTAVNNAVDPLIKANKEAADRAAELEKNERETLTNTIVNSGIRDKEELEHQPIANLRKIAEKVKPGTSKALANGATDPKDRGDWVAPKGDE